LRFEWDQRKSASNRAKHGVAFEEAETVFGDERALLIGDPEHSKGEDRFILLGFSNRLRLLVVSHCYRADGDVIRLISARRATKRESRQYVMRWTK
jgi:hypothetical protein